MEHELDAAWSARRSGLEGRARVCARRAAGVALREYCKSHQIPAPSSAIDLLRTVDALPGLPERVKGIAVHLLERVDVEFHLSSGVDLLEETRELINLINEMEKG